MTSNWKKLTQAMICLVFLTGILGPAAITTEGKFTKVHPLLRELAVDAPDQKVAVIVQKVGDSEEAESLVAGLGGEITKDLHIINAFAAEMPASAAMQLAREPGVRWMSLDAPVESVGKSSQAVSTYYLYNNPYPAQGDTVSQPVLPLSETVPTTETLYNYDKDRDAFPGRLIQKGGETDGSDPTRIQHWRLDAATSSVLLSGQVKFTLYAAMKDFNTSKSGQIQAFLFDWDGDQAVTVATALVANASWTGDWQPLGIDFGSVSYTLPENHQLGVSVVVTSESDDDMWFAYGTTAYPSALAVTDGADDTSSQSTQNTFLGTLGVRRVWEMGYRGEGVAVAVIDSGISTDGDFGERIQRRMSLSPNSRTVNDVYGHGTHVAGILGGNGVDSQGAYQGIAPGVNLMSLKISDEKGMAYESDVVAALQWVLDNKDRYSIRVVNMSINSAVKSSYHTNPMDAAAEILWFNGVVVVVSSGNSGWKMIDMAPANDPFLITVGATEENGTQDPSDDSIAAFTSNGKTSDGFFKPEIYAPGKDIISVLSADSNWDEDHPSRVVLGGEYFRLSGTSMAAPMVAGAAALLLQAEPGLTPDQVKYRLMNSANKIKGKSYLNIYTAITTKTTKSANTGIEASQLLWTGDEPITWDSVNWNSVNWNSVNWNSVNWNSVNWNSVNWNGVSWDE